MHSADDPPRDTTVTNNGDVHSPSSPSLVSKPPTDEVTQQVNHYTVMTSVNYIIQARAIWSGESIEDLTSKNELLAAQVASLTTESSSSKHNALSTQPTQPTQRAPKLFNRHVYHTEHSIYWPKASVCCLSRRLQIRWHNENVEGNEAEFLWGYNHSLLLPMIVPRDIQLTRYVPILEKWPPRLNVSLKLFMSH